MYLKKKISKRDNLYLIDLAISNFKINLEQIKEALESSDEVIILYNNQDKPIGFICYDYIYDDTAFIKFAVLDQRYRGKGITSIIFPVFVKFIKKKGINKLSGVVNTKNIKAIQIFKHWGFQTIMYSPQGNLIQLNL